MVLGATCSTYRASIIADLKFAAQFPDLFTAGAREPAIALVHDYLLSNCFVHRVGQDDRGE